MIYLPSPAIKILQLAQETIVLLQKINFHSVDRERKGFKSLGGFTNITPQSLSRHKKLHLLQGINKYNTHSNVWITVNKTVYVNVRSRVWGTLCDIYMYHLYIRIDLMLTFCKRTKGTALTYFPNA